MPGYAALNGASAIHDVISTQAAEVPVPPRAPTDLRIHAGRSYLVGRLAGPEREQLADALFEVFSTRFVGPPREMVIDRVILRDPATRLTVFRNAAGEVLGFCSTGWERVVDDRGRACAIFDAGAYFRPGVKGGGGAAFVRLAGHLLWGKLTRPFRRILYMGAATGPAIYHLGGSHAWRMLPRYDRSPPGEVTALVRKVMARRGYRFVEGDPWRITLGIDFAFVDEARMQAWVDRSHSPWVRHFVEHNPGYLKGEWLVMTSPLGIVDLLAFGWRGLRSFRKGRRQSCG